MRITQKALAYQVAHLNSMLGRPMTAFDQLGDGSIDWHVGHIKTSVGATGISLMEIHNDAGGTNQLFFGKTADVYTFIRGAIAGIAMRNSQIYDTLVREKQNGTTR